MIIFQEFAPCNYRFHLPPSPADARDGTVIFLRKTQSCALASIAVNMGWDKFISQFRVISHRVQQTKKKKTQDMIFQRASEIVRRNSLSLTRMMENPAVARWTEQLGKTTKTVRIHCSAFCAQRMRRSAQMFSFYRNLYGESLLFKVVTRMRGSLPRVPRAYLFAAAAFCWKEERITDERIQG